MKQVPGGFLQVVDNDIQAISNLLVSNARDDEKSKLSTWYLKAAIRRHQKEKMGKNPTYTYMVS